MGRVDRWGVPVLALAVALVPLLAQSSASAQVRTPAGSAIPLDGAGAPRLTGVELTDDLADSLSLMTVPAHLTPPLDSASTSEPVINFDGCHLHTAGTHSKPCVFGDTSSTTTVVMFGDSHMAQWFPALQIIAKLEHWRLLDFTKDGCTPAEVSVVRVDGMAPYPQCTLWRRNSLDAIAAIHPAMVLVQWDRDLSDEARPLAGVPIGYGSVWQDGVAATFKALHADSRLVVFIEDTPELQRIAPACVSANPTDVQACTSARTVSDKETIVRHEEIVLADEEGVSILNPVSWFCTPRSCPAIVGSILVYRDNSHMVPAYADFIAPVLESALAHLGAPVA
jgi:hypothetical protein